MAEALILSSERLPYMPSMQDIMSTEGNTLPATKNFHASMCSLGLDTHVGKHLLMMYIECGSLLDAHQVFHKLPHHNQDHWSLLIQAYVDANESERAFMLFLDMQCMCIEPNAYTYIALLRSCARQRSIYKGQDLHFKVVQQGLERDLFVGSVLVNMYAKCRLLSDAHDVFNELPVHNVVSWTALMAGYAEQGLHDNVLRLLEQMQSEGVCPNPVTFAYSLKACSGRFFNKGQEIHASILKGGLEDDNIIRNSLIMMYANHGLLGEACNLFRQLRVRNVVMWTALMVAHSDSGLKETALECLEEMKLDGVYPDCVAFVCGLKACSSIRSISKGRELHAEIVREGHELDLRIVNSIVDMYAKFGLVEEAREIFEELQVNNSAFHRPILEHGFEGNVLTNGNPTQQGSPPDVVSWTAMISGYAEEGKLEEALELFASMQEQGVLPNYVTFVGVVKACGNASALYAGRVLHARYARCRDSKTTPQVVVGTALVDMYSKCGNMADAQQVIEHMFARDLVAWNALLSGYACQGERERVMKLVKRMRFECLYLDEAAVVNVLTVCCHSGLVDTVWENVECIIREYGCFPTVKQLNCVIDLLCRSGSLAEAFYIVDRLSVSLNLVTWSIILSALQTQAEMEFG